MAAHDDHDSVRRFCLWMGISVLGLAAAGFGLAVFAIVPPLVVAVHLKRDGGRRVPLGGSVFGGLSATLFTVEVVTGSNSVVLDVLYLVGQLVGVGVLAWNCRHFRPRSVLGADIFCVLACSSLMGWLFFGVVVDGDTHVAVLGALSFGNLMTMWMLLMQFNRHTRALRWFGTLTAPTLAVGYFVEAFGAVRSDSAWLGASDVIYAVSPLFITGGLLLSQPVDQTPASFEADARMSALWMSGALVVGGTTAGLGLTRPNAELFVGVTVAVLVFASLWRVAAAAVLEARLYRLALISAQTDPETHALSRFAIRDEIAGLAVGTTVAKVRLKHFHELRDRVGPTQADLVLADIARQLSVVPHDSLGRTSEFELVLIADDHWQFTSESLRDALVASASPGAADLVGLAVAAVVVEPGDTPSSIDFRLDEAIFA